MDKVPRELIPTIPGSFGLVFFLAVGATGCATSVGNGYVFDAGSSDSDGGAPVLDATIEPLDSAFMDSGATDASTIVTCAEFSCGKNSACDDSSGTPECVCSPGYIVDEVTQSCALDRSSCASLLASIPTLLSGEYQLEGDSGLFTVECDMETDGGGWRVLYEEDFEESGAAASWSHGAVATDDCGLVFTRFLGGVFQFGAGASTSITLDLAAIPHNEARFELDFLVIDDWDGERGYVVIGTPGGTQFVQTPSYWNPGQTEDVCGGQMQGDLGPQRITRSYDHTADELSLTIGSYLDEDAGNESFGVDNVRVLIR